MVLRVIWAGTASIFPNSLRYARPSLAERGTVVLRVVIGWARQVFSRTPSAALVPLCERGTIVSMCFTFNRTHAVEPATACSKSSSKLGFCSLNRSFNLSVFSFQFSVFQSSSGFSVGRHMWYFTAMMRVRNTAAPHARWVNIAGMPSNMHSANTRPPTMQAMA